MQKLLFLSGLLVALLIAPQFATDARAGVPGVRDGSDRKASSNGAAEPDVTVRSIIAASEQHFQKGESCFAAGNLDGARREFDIAVDSMIGSGIDVRSDTRLYASWRELIEKISRYQSATPAAASTVASASGPAVDTASNQTAVNQAQVPGWGLQEFDGRPSPEPGEVAIPSVTAPHGALTIAAFQRQFAELGNKFRAKYGRDFIVTGADHEEHRRLYGSGSAYDIRVRDLSAEQIKFIIATGEELGLRVKDFSTWEKVQAHNSRVLSLGLPHDTLATAAHIHIDREASPAKKTYVATPAVKTSSSLQ